MFGRLLLFFVLVPLVELVLLLLLGDMTRWWVPLVLILVTGALGTMLSRQQGMVVYRQIQAELAAGRMPTDAMIDGAMILIAGLLLVTPGVLSDLLGISAMIPPVRAYYRRQLVAWFHRTFKVNTNFTQGFTQQPNVVDSYVVEKDSPDSVSDQV